MVIWIAADDIAKAIDFAVAIAQVTSVAVDAGVIVASITN